MGLYPEGIPKALSECVACLWVPMMTDYTSWSRVEGLDVVHQLPSIRMPAEAVYGDYVTSDRYHMSLTSVHEGDLWVTRLEPPS